MMYAHDRRRGDTTRCRQRHQTRNSVGLPGLLSGQVLGKVRLANFQNIEDAATCTSGCRVSLWCCWLLHERIKVVSALHKCRTALVVVLEDAQSFLNTCDSLLKLCLCRVER